MSDDCVICRGKAGDAELFRTQVWEDPLWRLTISLEAEVLGFCYLEPKRHVPHIEDLDGEEALSIGPTLARVSSVLKEITGEERVYLYVFGGGIPHLHVHLAPHHPGDALNENMIRGEVVEVKLDNGATQYQSRDFPPLPKDEQLKIANRLRKRLAE